EYLRRTAGELACRITIVAPDGRVTHDTDVLPADVAAMENHGKRPEVLEARRLGTGTARRFSTTENEDRLYFARTLSSGAVLRLSVAAAQVRQLESPYLWPARAAIVAACLGLFLIGRSLSRRFSEPIARLTSAASAIAAGDTGRVLPDSGGE